MASLHFHRTTAGKNLSSPNFKKIFRRSKKASKIKASGAKKIFLPGRFQNRIRTRSGKKNDRKRRRLLTHRHTRPHIRTHTHMHTDACACIRLRAYTHTYACTHEHTCARLPAYAFTCTHGHTPARSRIRTHGSAYTDTDARKERQRNRSRQDSGTDKNRREQTGEQVSRAGTDRRIIDQERTRRRHRLNYIDSARPHTVRIRPHARTNGPPRIHARLRARWIVGTPDHHSHRRNTALKRSNICSKSNGCSAQGTSQPPLPMRGGETPVFSPIKVEFFHLFRYLKPAYLSGIFRLHMCISLENNLHKFQKGTKRNFLI